jgi:hypothetical protein
MTDEFSFDACLCYSRRDLLKVRRLAEKLKNANLRVWFDEWERQEGPGVGVDTQQGLASSRALILCMSEAAFGPEWGHLERQTMAFRDPSNRSRRFLPVLLEDCNIREQVRRFHRYDWQDESRESLEGLVAALRLARSANRPVSESFHHENELNFQSIVELYGHNGSITSIAITSDSRFALTAGTDGTLRIWDLSWQEREEGVAPEEHFLLASNLDPIHACAVSPDDKIAVSAGLDDSVRFWDLSGKKRLAVLRCPGQSVSALRILPGNRRVVCGCDDGVLRVWEIKNQVCINEVQATDCRISSIALSGDGRIAIVGSAEGKLESWDLRRMERTTEFPGHSREILATALNVNGDLVLSSGRDGTVRLWDLKKKKEVAILEGNQGSVRAVSFSHGDNLAISVGDDGVRAWHVPSGETIGTLIKAFGVAALTPDGTRLVTALPNCHLELWKLTWSENRGPKRPAPMKVAEKPVASQTVRYTNAKVVLLGDSGSGKTGLSNRLVDDRYDLTESTHGMSIRRLKCPASEEDGTEREVWLWDLAGQDDYRLIHQFFLSEVSLAVVVTDPQSDDPFAPVDAWLKGLATATRESAPEGYETFGRGTNRPWRNEGERGKD